MSTVESESIPAYDMMASVKNMKVVDKAFELPVVTSAYNEIVSLTSPITPYVKTTVTFITPYVEGGYNTIKEKVIPRIPEGTAETIQSKVNGAVAHLSVAVEKVDAFACGGMEQLVEKVPSLKEETPELIKNSKDSATVYLNDTTSFLASFSVALVLLKMFDASLDIVESAIVKTGGSDKDFLPSYVKKIHIMANDLRFEGSKRAGTDKSKQIEDASIVGAIMEIIGLAYLMRVLGLRPSKAEIDEVCD